MFEKTRRHDRIFRGLPMRTAFAAGLLSLTGGMIASAPAYAQPVVRVDDPGNVRGAVYVPAGAWNAPQMWKNFSRAEADRDLGYARELNLNSLRVWASYEYWQMDPEKFAANFDSFLASAKAHHIRILVALFENVGEEPTQANMWSTDPRTAFAILSPARAIAADNTRWEAPRKFVRWFMKRYGDDDRLLAIEVMNEPQYRGQKVATLPFAMDMFRTAKAVQGTVPLTIGTNTLDVAEKFVPLGLDILQFHNNFPQDDASFRSNVAAAMALGKRAGIPVWLTEWQRIRSGGSGWADEPVTSGDAGISYGPLAHDVRQYHIGNFFWSLMVKRAYLKVQRFKGTVNGLVWPDGSVASLADARAIAGDPTLDMPEKPIPADFGALPAKADGQ
ncbi:cellulase family glycosylhydrolase [Stakelama sp. CBK3Z-3]|uniref:Cellulase family glycosylhydrolase n=1 Tax=Stakelama flava TaxID=2860338 RepID=A0ABS6XIB8_9SPHN|nr:cellulase family glycosylhydrolase [Stakelama flava]MBW4329935.1 cellulase family glycosylhydrolase [Stakelama flava]